MRAKFASRCGYCGEEIAAGEPIGRSARVAGWLHEACVERSQPSGPEMTPSEFAARYARPSGQRPSPGGDGS